MNKVDSDEILICEVHKIAKTFPKCLQEICTPQKQMKYWIACVGIKMIIFV